MSPPILDAYYEDDMGSEVELMGVSIADGTDPAEVPGIVYAALLRRFGEDKADAWKLGGEMVRTAFMDQGGKL